MADQGMCRDPLDQTGSERGAALIVSLLLTIVVIGIVTTGGLLLDAHAKKTRTNFAANAQAVQVARSGLAETLAWLRRQTSQPVLTFAPVLDTSATPAILDTADPDIGLVREFKITGSVWARYEAWKDWPGDPDPVRLLRREQFRCEDISEPRAGGNPGMVWRLRSVGYVYHRDDPSVAFDQAPNRVISSQLMETEVRRIVIGLPGQAAVNVGDGNSCHVNTNGRIYGGASGAGIFYPQGSGTPTVGPASANRVTGSPALATTTTYDDSYEAVFGMGWSELTAMATMVITDPADFPSPIPSMSLIIIDVPTLHIDSTAPLLGTGIVIVRGNLVMNPGNDSNFSGLLYVEGNMTMRDPSAISGSVVCTGNMTLQGSADYATITFDEAILGQLMQNFGNYRLSNTLHLPRLAK